MTGQKLWLSFVKIFRKCSSWNPNQDQIIDVETAADMDMDLDAIFYKKLVCKKLETLETTKAPGPDWPPLMVLKKTAEFISLPMSVLFQKSFESGALTDDWKKRTSPQYTLNSNDVDNYQPVLFTSIACKLIGSIVGDAILEDLAQYKLISIHQHGFICA